MRCVYRILAHLTALVTLHLGELDILWVGPNGGLSDRVTLHVTDGDGVVITGQGQQVLVTPRPTGDSPRVLPQDRHLPVKHPNRTHLNTVCIIIPDKTYCYMYIISGNINQNRK